MQSAFERIYAVVRQIPCGKVATYPGAIVVYSINGQVVASGSDAVGLQHLSRGVYILQGRNGSHVETIKVTIGS